MGHFVRSNRPQKKIRGTAPNLKDEFVYPERMFGAVIRRLRKRKDITMIEFAGHIGRTSSYVSAVERGQTAPFPDYLMGKVAELLAVSQDRLIDLAEQTREYFK